MDEISPAPSPVPPDGTKESRWGATILRSIAAALALIAAAFTTGLGILHLDPALILGEGNAVYFFFMDGRVAFIFLEAIAVFYSSIVLRTLFCCTGAKFSCTALGLDS